MSQPFAMKCRTCMQDCNRFHQLDDYVENNFKILEMLDRIVPQIYIKIPCQLSKFVCNLCLDKLLTSYKFQLLCIETHKILTGCVGAIVTELDLKQEVNVDPLMENDCIDTKEEMEDNICYKYGRKVKEACDFEESEDYSVIINDDDSDTDSSNEKLNVLKERRLRKMAKSTENGFSKLSCQICGKMFKHLSRLETHEQLHRNSNLNTILSCNICGRRFEREKSFRDHMKKHRKKTENENKAIDSQTSIAPMNFRRNPEKKKGRLKKISKIGDDSNLASGSSEEEAVINSEIVAVKTECQFPEIAKNEMEISQTIFEEPPIYDWSNNETDFKKAQNEPLKKKTPKKPKHGKNTDFVDTGVGEVEKPNKNNRRNGHFPCEVCGKIFDRSYRLKRHSSVHSLNKPYACEICKCRFTSASYLKAHKLLHDTKNKGEVISLASAEGYKCPDCPRRFEKQASLSAHRQIHTRDAFTANYGCTICQRVFTNVKSLTDHITNDHPQVERHQCELCDKTFVLHAHLVEHLNRHKGNKNHVCVICEKQFGFMNTLKEHMRTHNGESPYLCPQCGKTFRNASNLRQHMERHSGLKKYQCSECPSRFKCRSDLKKHIDTHTNIKPHECDICGSCFTRSYSLQKHKRLHTGKRPFKCDQCNMTFALLYHLKRHIRTHTGEKPYKCKFCERAYAESGDLNKHLRTHVGENTYICDQCSMTFKYQSELRQHISEHYKIDKKIKKGAEATRKAERQHEINISSSRSCCNTSDLMSTQQSVMTMSGGSQGEISTSINKDILIV